MWQELEARNGSNLACSWDWTGTWLEHYGDVVPHRFVVAEKQGDPRGIALVTEQVGRGPLRPRAIHIGTAGEPPGTSVFVERNGLLACAANRDAFGAALMTELHRDPSWDRLELDGFCPRDADGLLAGRQLAALRVDECPVAHLGGQVDGDLPAWLPASRRKRISRALRQFGQLECEWAETSAMAHAILDELITLHAARWHADGQTGAFASPRFTAFHRALVDRLLPSGRAVLFRVRRSGDTIGCLYGFVEGERLLFYQSGLRQYDDNRLRPGIAVHVLCMRACRERGLREYDFLAPASRYKRELSTRTDTLVWATLERPGMRVRLERGARHLVRRVRRQA